MKRMLKAAVALLLIYVLLRGVDWSRTKQVLDEVHWWALALALVFMVWEILLSTVKWDWALRMHGLRFGVGYLFQVQAQGYFANNFLPTAIGGDAYRAFKTMPASGYKSRAVSAVLLERVSGLAALLFIGALAAFVLMSDSKAARWYLVCCAIGAMAAIVPSIGLYLGAFKPLTNRIRHLSAFEALSHNLDHLRRARREWIYIVGLSLIYQSTSVGLLYFYFMLVGSPIGFAQAALLAAVAGIAGVLPLSINGIGIVEGSIVGVATALGIDYESAVVVAVLRRLMMVALSVLCGISFLVDRESAPRAIES
jgi:glycosyltransferase 2 family protein